MASFETSDYISIGAACIALFSLGWNIYNYYRNDRKQLKVNAYNDIIGNPEYDDDPSYSGERFFIVEITNICKHEIWYSPPYILHENGNKEYLDTDDEAKYSLRPGQTTRIRYQDEHWITKNDFVNFNIGVYRIVVKDAFGNKHKSNTVRGTYPY